MASVWRAASLGIAAILGVLLASCASNPAPSTVVPGTALPDATSVDAPVFRGPRPAEWWIRPDQLGAQSTQGTFAIKLVEIANLNLHVYYAMRAPTPGPPQASASITATVCPQQASAGGPGAVRVQSFGRLDDVEIGVVHMPIVNRPGQLVTLATSPHAAGAPVWSLTFLEQIAPLAHSPGFEAMNIDTATLLPEVQVHTALGYQGNRWSGYFARAQPGTPSSYLPATFFVLEHDGSVTQISHTAFTSGTSAGAVNAGAYIPHLTYPPTSSPSGTGNMTPTPPRVQC